MSYNSSRELAQKMGSEGGLGELIFDYGFNHEDIPDDMPEHIRMSLHHLLAVVDSYEEVQDFLYKRMGTDPNPGDWDYEGE